MPKVQSRCTHCRIGVRASVRKLGAPVKCPTCGRSFLFEEEPPALLQSNGKPTCFETAADETPKEDRPSRWLVAATVAVAIVFVLLLLFVGMPIFRHLPRAMKSQASGASTLDSDDAAARSRSEVTSGRPRGQGPIKEGPSDALAEKPN